MRLKIEKGIPVPGKKTKAEIEAMMEVFKKMKAGDSVLVRGIKPGTISTRAWHHFGSGNYAMRKENGGMRVWKLLERAK